LTWRSALPAIPVVVYWIVNVAAEFVKPLARLLKRSLVMQHSEVDTTAEATALVQDLTRYHFLQLAVWILESIAYLFLLMIVIRISVQLFRTRRYSVRTPRAANAE
jgi:hypothetical protein